MILRLVVTIFVYSLLGWLLCDIDPYQEYSWYSGIWHGMFFIANWIRSWFGDALYKAESYTTAYNVFYWIFSSLSVLGTIFGSARK
jgi:ABC-type antimicrobial peptide transport system permease subunit